MSAETPQPAPNSVVANNVERSKNGLIEYMVPLKMIAGKASKVTVKIHGHLDRQTAAANAARTGSLKTSQYMKVLLLAEDLGELKVASQENADIQYVPEKGTATWTWSVIPVAAAANQKLQVRVYEEYSTDSDQDVDGASFTVDVTAPSRLALASEAFLEDPDAWWKYWLPTGAGFFLLIVIFWRVIDRRLKIEDLPSNFDATTGSSSSRRARLPDQR